MGKRGRHAVIALLIWAAASPLTTVTAQFFFEVVEEETTTKDPLACTTPDGLPGRCLFLYDCASILNLLRRKPLSTAIRAHLRASVCGFTQPRVPDVCCPSLRPARPSSLTTTTASTTRSTTSSTTTTTTTTTSTTTSTATTSTTSTTFTTTTSTTTTTTTSTTTTTATTTTSPKTPSTTSTTTTTPPTTTSTTTTTTTTTSSSTTASKPFLNETKMALQEEILDFVEIPGYAECGHSPVIHVRVVGGDFSEVNGWPWIAALGYQLSEDELKFLCGGSLITSRHVLSAAHCLVRDDLVLVRLGEHDVGRDDDGAEPVDVAVQDRLIHSGYHPRFYHNDIGLIKLSESVSFSEKISPVCLPLLDATVNSDLHVQQQHFAAGWGTTSFRGPTSDVLKEILLTVLDNADCAEKYSRFRNVRITDTKLCARDPLEFGSACQGDSGGPFMRSYEDVAPEGAGGRFFRSRWFLTGVVSFGYKCAEPDFPGVYTRVASFSQWIEDNLNEPYDNADVL